VERGCRKAVTDLLICERMAKNLALLAQNTADAPTSSVVYNQSVQMLVGKVRQQEAHSRNAHLSPLSTSTDS